MNKRVLLKITTLVILALCSCHKSESISRKKIENRFKQRKEKYKTLSDSIKKSFKEENFPSIKEDLREYLSIAKKYKNEIRIGIAYYKYGYYYNKFKKLDSAYYFFKEAIPYFVKMDDSVRVAKTLTHIMIIESKFNNFNESNETASKTLNYLTENNSESKALVYNTIGINFRNLKRFKDGIDFYSKAINSSKSKKNILIYKNNKANLYGDAGNYAKAISILNGLLLDKSTKEHSKLYARVIDNLAYKKWLINSKAKVLKEFREAKEIREKEKDSKGLIASYAHLSDYYKKIYKEEAKKFAYKMLRTAEKLKSPSDIIEALDKLRELETSNKGRELGLRRSRIKDSLELTKDKSQHQFALIKYDYEKLEKKAMAQKLIAERNQKEKQQLGFLVIVSSLIFLIYIAYRKEKSDKEKVKEIYNTETRLAKRIHDELANDVYLAMNKIQNGVSQSKTAILSDLEHIYAQTRDISHENSPIITGEKFQEFLQQLFIDFSGMNCTVISKGISEVELSKLEVEKQIILYRVLQELLINQKKHSKANIVVIGFSKEKGRLHVSYKDNGEGTEIIKRKNGLQNMETRILSIRGTITFESEKQQGFQAKFQFKI